MLTEAKIPSGGFASPSEFSPQQATVPSTITPQLWFFPALRELNSPPGGVTWP